MGMMTRMLRIWKADLHGVMDQIEDKGLLLKQYLREMETSLQHKQARCEQLTQSQRQITRDLDQRREEMDKLGKDIDLALKKEKEDIARMLIRKRQNLQASLIHLQQQLDLLTEEHQKLLSLVDEQRLQYDQLKLKADAYLRQEQARQFDTAGGGCKGSSVFCSPSEDEVELELLQRKEALSQGGVS